MTLPGQTTAHAACHCGKCTLQLAFPPAEVTQCNCSLCVATGVLWTYCDVADVLELPDPSLTDTYAWNGRHVDFHRCRDCGCVTHWLPRDDARRDRGINARMFGAAVLGRARVRHKDGANTGEYIDAPESADVPASATAESPAIDAASGEPAVSRDRAREIAAFAIRGDRRLGGIGEVFSPAEMAGRRVTIFDGAGIPWAQSWVAYAEFRDWGRLRSSVILVVDQRTGEVHYYGDAGDEG